jgi:dipeptidyl aminopeptidase/acylaminoacyl peptidase
MSGEFELRDSNFEIHGVIVRLMRYALIVLFAAASVFAQDTYQLPPKEIAEVVDAPLTPTLLPWFGDWGVLYEPPTLLTISDLSQPELKLAGLRFNPRNHEQTRAPYGKDLRLLRFSTGEQRTIAGLPSPLRARNLTWSPDGSRLAFTAANEAGLELWVVEAATATARRVGSELVNASSPSRPIHWLSDNSTLAVRAVPTTRRGAEPAEPGVPSGPVIQENVGRRTPGRTYQDLLKDAYDADLYEHHARSQVVLVSLDGTAKTIGAPALIVRAEPSPDANYLLVETIHRPFSYVVPESRFPRRIEVWDRSGNVIRQIADLPLADAVPTDFDAAREGPRNVAWRADVPATLFWVEALDKGDPRTKAELRDRLLTLAAPFAGEPQQLAALAMRFNDIEWESDDLALVSEEWWKTRRTRTWRVRPGTPSAQAELIFDRSSEDRYANPGSPVVRANQRGRFVLRRSGDTIYLFGEGASPEGDRPFVDSFNLMTKKATRLWRSEAPNYEYGVVMLDDGRRVVTRSESVSTPPNFFLRDLRGKSKRALTSFPHPTPQLATVKKELIRYKRADGVDLTGTLYLPPGYDPARDGRLPVLMWAYPQEFKSASAAGQVSDSPYRFVRVSPMSPLPWLVRGYAIFDDPSIPIIGEGDKEPNDTYVEQLVAGAEAAIDEVVRRGIGDRSRIAVGGHSYGAFMTANLLAHSDLFRAGIARSGAYNRTLTPFSFQAEERTFWQAADTYMKMSPFTHADKIKEPLLLIHGIDDNNTGTFPIQSERLYQAMKGLGGTARLVMLPFESHGYRARESVMHMLWEMDRWLERYVKKPGAEGQKAEGTPVP